MKPDPAPDPQWYAIVTELQECRDSVPDTWDDVDELLVARYLAGECNEDERANVEQASQSYSDLRDCISLGREILANAHASEPLQDVVSASNLVGSAQPKRQSAFRRLRRAVIYGGVRAWAAAACLLIAVGLGWLLLARVDYLNRQIVALQTGRQDSPTGATQAQVESMRNTLNDLRTQIAELSESSGVASEVRLKPPAQLGPSDIDVPVTTMMPILEPPCLTSPNLSPPNGPTAIRREPSAMQQVPYQVCRYVEEERVDPTGMRRTIRRPVWETSRREESVRDLPRDPSDNAPLLPTEDLIMALQHSEELVRWAAADALTRVAGDESGSEARARIVQMLSSLDDQGRAAAEYVLTGRVTEGFGVNLSQASLDAIERHERLVRWAGLHYFLVATGGFEGHGPAVRSQPSVQPDYVPTLVQRLTLIVRDNEQDALIRKAAIYLLGQFGGQAKPALNDLIQVVKGDEDPQSRRWAAYAIGQIGPDAKAALPVFAGIILARTPNNDQVADATVFPAVAYAFGEICRGDAQFSETDEVVSALIACLKDSNPNVSHWAAYALSRIDKPYRADAIPTLPTLDSSTSGSGQEPFSAPAQPGPEDRRPEKPISGGDALEPIPPHLLPPIPTTNDK